MMITEPLHVAFVNDKQLRFFRSPNNEGRPDLPWHATDDLQSVFGLNPAQCGIMTTMWWNGPFEYVFHTIETSDGPMTIAPHCVALAAISSLVELIGIGFAEDIDRTYSIGWTDACKKLYGDLRGARLEMWMRAAFDRYDEYDVADSTLDSFASRVRDSLRKFTLQC